MWSILTFPFRAIGTLLSLIFEFIGSIFSFVFGLVGGVFSFIFGGLFFFLVIIGVVALVRWFVRGVRG